MSVQILIVDDHEAIREGLTQMLEGSNISVAATSSGGDEALSEIESLSLDAVLLDVRLSRMDGLSMLEKILVAKSQLPVIMLSAYDNPTYIARAAAIGAADYLLKSDSREVIIDSIKCAVAGTGLPTESKLGRIEAMMQRNEASGDLPPELPLTPREVQVMRHIGLGLSNKEIAKSLSISVETVKEHVQNILRKAGANDRTDAAVRAVRLGLVD
ncbi:response regulator transcription factor [Planctomycetes bacterium K23_9]|uniref:Transcriptional regulatory protein DegU n=1 Tax=Stieleria marina TaxID=1930275 RepID=A0A517P0A2_9BACT|nr:Transcriptional regulatory protein DegU [Planctomycetes bacterium K23_9]